MRTALEAVFFGVAAAAAAAESIGVIRFDADVSRPSPYQARTVRGSTVTLEARLTAGGEPVALPSGAEAEFCWQTNGMDRLYWTTPAEAGTNGVLRAVWTPDMDPGASDVRFFFRAATPDGEADYSAHGGLRILPGPGETPGSIPLPAPVLDFAAVEIRNPPWPNSVSAAARPLPEYLHALEFDDTYPDDAAWYYRQPQDYGACSSVRFGDALSRNYDWRFDDAAEFVVRVSAAEGRFASLGVASVGTNLTEYAVTSGKPSRYYKCLPGRVVDGINERGVVAEVNVVGGTPPAPTGGDIHPLAAVRWTLDSATDAHMAATSLAARVSFPPGWTQNFHWMVADENETYIVENGAAHKVTGRAAMTNFPLYPRGTGEGQERYDLLVGGANITNAWFTRAYLRSTDWASDFGSAAEEEAAKAAWETHGREELRGRGFWQTVHTSVYDIPARSLRVAVQEQDDWYVFALSDAVTADALAAATNAVAMHGGFASDNFAWIRAAPVFPPGGVTTNVVGDTLVTWRGAGVIPDRRLSVVSDNPEAETEGGSFEQVSGAEFGTLSNDLIRATGTPGPVGVRHAAESGRVISALVPMAPLARPECINDPEASVPGSQREQYEVLFTTPFSNVDTTRTLTYRHCLGSADGTWTAPLALQLYDTDDPDRVHPSACNPDFFFPELADALRVQSVTRGDWFGCPPFIAVAPHVVIAPWHWTRGRGDTSTRFCFSRSPADFREVRFARPIGEPAWVMGDTAFYVTLDETPAQVYFWRSSDVFDRAGISTYMHGLPFFALNAHNCVVPVIAYTHTGGSNVPVPWRSRATMLSTDKAHLSPGLYLGYPNFPQLGHRAHKFDSGHGVYCFSPWGGITPDDAPVLVAHYTTSTRGPAYMSDETIAEIARIVETITGGEESIKILGEAAE